MNLQCKQLFFFYLKHWQLSIKCLYTKSKYIKPQMHIISIMFFSMSWISKICLNVQIYICVCTPCINICLYIYIYIYAECAYINTCAYIHICGVCINTIYVTFIVVNNEDHNISAKSVLSSGQLQIIPSATKGLLGFCILVWVHYKCLCESNNESIIILLLFC